MYNEHARAALVQAGPIPATAALAATRAKIESAEFHLRGIVELGDKLDACRTGFEERVAGNDPAEIEVARQFVSGPTVEVALGHVARARIALAELAQWEERGDG